MVARTRLVLVAQLNNVEELAKYMGPLASMLVKQAADETESIDDFISILTDDIPSEHEREEFTISIRASMAS